MVRSQGDGGVTGVRGSIIDRRSGKIRNILAALCCAVMVSSCTSGEVPSLPADPQLPQESVETPGSIAEPQHFYVDITMTGGSGKARILSPVEITVDQGSMTAALIWSSANYDYMLVDGTRYDNENPGGASTFHVPVPSLDTPLKVIGDTVAMSTPHEITYEISWGQQHLTLEESAGVEEETIRPEDTEEDTPQQMRRDTAGAGPSRENGQALTDAGIIRTGELSLRYAVGFSVTEYGDYAWISIPNSGEYLLIPEGGSIPDGLSNDVVCLQKPLDHTYLVSTASMDLISRCGGLSMIRLSGTRESDWYIQEARDAMQRGDIRYAGRYSAPDYELILQEGCRLAVENTMIYHEPAVQSKLEELGIPVLVETSSYEKHPLGRLEWIKLYGLLFDRLDAAQAFFDSEAGRFETLISEEEGTKPRVAFFHVTAGGLINVRRAGDYITTMIDLAGGQYVPAAEADAGEDTGALSSMNMQMEDFYAQARDADILIYNSTIGGEIGSVAELTGRNPLFADFRAVENGQVYCTERNLFQQISGMTAFMQDLHDVFSHTDRAYTYLNRLE